MTIKYITGDLFSTLDLVIVHGCNAQGVMGSGVAKVVREKYPTAYREYVKFCQPSVDAAQTRLLLGKNCTVYTQNKVIVNAITQDSYGAGIKQVSYDAVDMCMYELTKRLTSVSDLDGNVFRPRLSMPKIGAGLGGGNWEVIEAIINDRLADFDVSVYVLE